MCSKGCSFAYSRNVAERLWLVISCVGSSPLPSLWYGLTFKLNKTYFHSHSQSWWTYFNWFSYWMPCSRSQYTLIQSIWKFVIHRSLCSSSFLRSRKRRMIIPVNEMQQTQQTASNFNAHPTNKSSATFVHDIKSREIYFRFDNQCLTANKISLIMFRIFIHSSDHSSK